MNYARTQSNYGRVNAEDRATSAAKHSKSYKYRMKMSIGIMSPGDMGHAIGNRLNGAGFTLYTSLEGRSDLTRKLAGEAGLIDLGTVEHLVEKVDLFFSILPPSAAVSLAQEVATVIAKLERSLIYVDFNAISPQTAKEVAATIEGAGASFVDGGIIGPPPGVGSPSIYLSGTDTAPVENLLRSAGLEAISLGDEAGKASSVKMCYSAINKGTNALQTAVLLTAERLGVGEALNGELKGRQEGLYNRIGKLIPFLPVNSGRWVKEMEEIADTFDSAGVTSHFHRGAAEFYQFLSTTDFAQETRDTFDQARGAEETITALARQLNKETF